MLLAGPSQATYPNRTTYSPAVSRLTISSSSTVSNTKSNESVRSPSSSSRFSLMKSISAQLNRGTELLKQTVQRHIFSKIPTVVAAPTAKPTPYHSDPRAVVRSCSVDSLHVETCHIRPIRPYSITPHRHRTTGETICSPKVVRPENRLVIKFSPIKTKARFKLQKANQRSAFVLLKKVADSPSSSAATKSPSKAAAGRGGKRKRSPTIEELDDDDFEVAEGTRAVQVITTTKRGRITMRGGRGRAAQEEGGSKKNIYNKKPTKASKQQRKSLEQEKQEREDFELAKKLQKQFDLTENSNGGDASSSNGGATTNITLTTTTSTRRTRNGRSLKNGVTTNYSLRNTRSLSKGGAPVTPILEKMRKSSPEPTNGLKTRNKRKRSEPIIIPSNNNNNNKTEKAAGRNTRSKANKRSTQ